jgi:tRNA-dependent cyclodipeptide synthase
MSDFDYSVRVKNGAGWRKFNRIRLMISVGKEYHEGKKLEAVVNWINRNPSVESIQVSVNDYLQRHNFIATGMTEEEAGNFSLVAGTAWMERNEETLSNLLQDWSFTRWNDWFRRPAFTSTHAALQSQIKVDPLLHDAIEIDAHSLAERKKLRGEFVPPCLVECSRNYVMEELAVFAMQSAELPAAEVYPGTSLTSVKYLRDKVLPEKIAPLSTRHVARIDFERIMKASSAGKHSFSQHASAA